MRSLCAYTQSVTQSTSTHGHRHNPRHSTTIYMQLTRRMRSRVNVHNSMGRPVANPNLPASHAHTCTSYALAWHTHALQSHVCAKCFPIEYIIGFHSSPVACVALYQCTSARLPLLVCGACAVNINSSGTRGRDTGACWLACLLYMCVAVRCLCASAPACIRASSEIIIRHVTSTSTNNARVWLDVAGCTLVRAHELVS